MKDIKKKMSHYIQSKSLKSAVTGRKITELGKPNLTYIILLTSSHHGREKWNRHNPSLRGQNLIKIHSGPKISKLSLQFKAFGWTKFEKFLQPW